jgi:photosystem II stability/assembly factor-like uncharacterized protein
MKYLLPVMFFLGVFLAENSSAQWMLTNGPYEAYARCLAAGKSALFAGTANGVFRSTNDGATWKSVNYYYPARTVLALVAQDSFIFAADTTGKIYRTSDNGSSWKLLRTKNPNIGLSVTDSLLFAFSWDGAIGRSTDHGDSLKLCTISSQSGIPEFYSIVRHDSILYAGTSSGIFTSRNEGKTWFSDQNFLSNSITSSLVGNNRFMFTGISQGYVGDPVGVFRSADGVHWDKINSGLLDTFVRALITTNDSTVFAGTNGGIYRSTNNGSSWKQVSAIGSILAFAASGNIMYAATYEHIVRSTDNGSNWKIIDSGMPFTHVSGLARNNADLYAVTDVGIFRYAQNNSWKPVFEKLGLTALAIHGDQFLTGGSNGDVYYSIDSGKSWVQSNTLVNGTIRSLAIDGNNFFAATDTYSGLLHSTDYGLTWSKALKQNSTLPQSIATIDSVIISANFLDGVFRSTDNGINWKNIYIDTVFGITYTIVAVGTEFWAGTRNGVFFSNDLGADWTRIGFADTGITTLAIDDKNIFAGINGYGIYKYDNGTWTSVPDTLTDKNINYLTMDNSDLFYASSTGIWRRSLNEITSGIKNVFTGNGIQLHASYPNPFSAKTMLSLSSSKREFVDIKIFDILGNQCSKIFSGELDEGKHSFEWNASDLPNGIYNCIVRSADGLMTEQLIVVH